MGHERRALREGLVVGMIGYASVAVLDAVIDLFAARGPLYTVDLLGKSVFMGLRDPAVLALPMQPDMMAIFWYNGLHLLVSLAIGLTVTGLVEHAERRPSMARMVLFTIVAVGLMTTPMRPVLPWWSIVVSNTAAVIAAGAYLMSKRPGTWNRLSPFAG